MSTYYTGKRVKSYNRFWKTFSERTLSATCSVIDYAQLQEIAATRELHILDAACGTGLLLYRLATVFPSAELYGFDESQDMLAQARLLLGNDPHIHLIQATLKGGEIAPYTPASFDLITCTNAFHYIDDPIAVLRGLALNSQGQLVIEDYARRMFPFPWRIFEWFIKRVDPQHIQAYTLTKAHKLCQAAGLQVMTAKEFSIDVLWQGWVISAHL